ncbi:MAG: hypothetical protein ACREDR_46755, partial [Blastocatellia bacterium]
DKARAITTAVLDPEWSQWSSRQIAKLCNVSYEYVNRLRKQIAGGNQAESVTVIRGGSESKPYQMRTGGFRGRTRVEQVPQNGSRPAGSQNPESNGSGGFTATDSAHHGGMSLPSSSSADAVSLAPNPPAVANPTLAGLVNEVWTNNGRLTLDSVLEAGYPSEVVFGALGDGFVECRDDTGGVLWFVRDPDAPAGDEPESGEASKEANGATATARAAHDEAFAASSPFDLADVVLVVQLFRHSGDPEDREVLVSAKLAGEVPGACVVSRDGRARDLGDFDGIVREVLEEFRSRLDAAAGQSDLVGAGAVPGLTANTGATV